MVTIADVAERAGVTTATVSNVVTGRVTVSSKTRARVLKAIAELGYRPNLLARGLARGRTYTIALVVPTITNPFFSEVVEEVERTADRNGFQIMLNTTHNVMELGKRHLERMASRWMDGCIVMSMAADITDVLEVAKLGKPVVLSAWDQDPRAAALPIVDIDFRSAGELATQHLVALGHRRIAAILELPVQQSRLDGYRLALATGDVAPDPTLLLAGDSSFESGYHAASAALALPEPPTAFFAGNDQMALGAIEAITARGLRVPGDVSVVGVDDIMQAAYSHPPLTTISIPKREMARAATELLLRLIERKDEAPAATHVTLVRPHLVERASTGRLG